MTRWAGVLEPFETLSGGDWTLQQEEEVEEDWDDGDEDWDDDDEDWDDEDEDWDDEDEDWDDEDEDDRPRRRADHEWN